MSDTADKLNAKELPIPTAERLNVFVADGVPDEARPRWESQGGATNFVSGLVKRQPAEFCGIALFVVGAYGFLTARVTEQLAPFYERAESEANVFQWQPIEKNFVRRDRHWFDERRSD